MKRNAFLMTIIAGLAFMTACGEKKEPPPASGSISAHVLAIRTESVPAVLAAPGTVQPRHRIALSSQLNGFVREVRVRAGDSVRQDQVLATLDARDAESQKAAAGAAIDEAQAAIAEAQKARLAAMDMRSAAKASADLAGQTLTRYQKLFDSRSVSPQEIDEVRARRDAGAAELASRESMVAAAEQKPRLVEPT
jgi:HlyD family secretion protein